MWAFLSHIATLIVVVLFWRRVEPKVFSILSRWEPKTVEAATPAASPRPSIQDAMDEDEYESVPQELYDIAMRESESWAREQSLAAMIQLKQRLKSWDRVRAFYASKDIN